MSASWPAPTRPDPQAEDEPAQPQLQLVTYRKGLVTAAQDAGIESARRGDPDLYAAALEAIRLRADTGGVFSADDVVADLAGAGGPMVGAAFRTAASRGLIVFAGTTTSTRQATHGRIQRQWRGASS